MISSIFFQYILTFGLHSAVEFLDMFGPHPLSPVHSLKSTTRLKIHVKFTDLVAKVAVNEKKTFFI